MSDYLFVVLPNVSLASAAGDEAANHVRQTCAGVIPHNHLCHFRINVTTDGRDTLLEPLVPGGLKEPLLRALADWAAERSSEVSIRLEGHRGEQALPPRERRSGTLLDALSYQSHRRRPHSVEIVVQP